MTSPNAFLLFSIFQIKHYLGDFVLQSKYMLLKAAPGWKFVRPLALHALVHGLMTSAIALFFVPGLWWLGAIDFAVHALIDRVKGSTRYLGRFNNPASNAYWRVFGLDQLAHHFTHIGLAWVIAIGNVRVL